MDEKSGPGEVTQTLHRFSKGDRLAADEVMQMLGSELRRLASLHMRKERDHHTLQTTGLLHEAFIRLFVASASQWNDRNHFLAVASRVMRQVLIDYARSHLRAARRGTTFELEAGRAKILPISSNVLDVDRALKELTAIAPRQVELVELRFFGGLSLDEAAEVLGVSPRTADKDWALAKAWLRRRLTSSR
jgi:RNA polymerase sigma-70 factor (ECF subfamily)